ncbi:hypothetical protein [Inhella sp.]|uniref:hypothetical protein n=1 Tax=Inhella sp. TaxID=1921806 RepID=UPI0035ADBD3E
MKNSPLLQRWQQANKAFDARVPRERWLLAVAGLAFVLWLGDRLWLAPAQRQLAQARQQAEQTEKALAELRTAQQLARDQAELQHKQREDELARLRTELQGLEGRPGALEGARMLALLEELVQRQQGGLKLRALTALPDAAAAPASAAAPAAGPRLYRHAIELVVSGSYGALHQYLRDLVQSEARLRVRQLSFTVREHPDIEMTLQVETLSPQAAWLTL